MRWGENETVEFSKCYLRHHCLWNPKHMYYKSKNKRSESYKEVIAEFYNATGIKLTDVEARVKVKNLRSTYYQELKKIKERSSHEGKYVPSLKWFDVWHKAFSNKPKKLGIGRRDSSTNIDVTTDADKEFSIEFTSNDNNDTDPFEQEDYKSLVLKPEPNESTTDSTHKKKRTKRNSSLDNTDKSYRYSIDTNTETNVEDEFDIYGKYIATQLRKMELRKALRVQLQIQNLVSEARLSDGDYIM